MYEGLARVLVIDVAPLAVTCHALTATIEALSDVKGVAPSALTPPLEQCVDTDALQQLAGHDSRSWELAFDYNGYQVTVSGDGWVSVDGEQVKQWCSHDGESRHKVPR